MSLLPIVGGRVFQRLLCIAILLALPVAPAGSASAQTSDLISARSKIKHIVIIMQENRSFDSYFGTYPGADGIPMKDGRPAVCAPDPKKGDCVAPFHDTSVENGGGPHAAEAVARDVDGGKMDGFIAAAAALSQGCFGDAPECSRGNAREVMGYHTDAEIPNYWTYARNFVLQDHLFESIASWSLPQHLYMVSEWSGICTRPNQPMSCKPALDWPDDPPDLESFKPAVASPDAISYAWTDLTYLLHKHHVSWTYYVMDADEPFCKDQEEGCTSPPRARTPDIWNPLAWFTTVRQDGEFKNIRDTEALFADAKNGTLPAVAWVTPSNRYSEHPPAWVSTGQAYVTGLIDAIMSGPDWDSTAIFLSWDDWGGFYDHVMPPKVNDFGYGFRVPGMLISPYAKRGFIDHQTLSHDAYTKLIEDLFLNGERIDPKTDGRPDPRTNVPENDSALGDLLTEFDFSQTPRAPLILPGGITPPYKAGMIGPP